ncbi:MAG TPA: Asp-tRNA(Asn)/Glu-tRNA(Gln) amidotransferase subunit GatC [Kiritimatiellia bacterium]|nr:Asp-tRNA(Asn)/Glu-tRNA(Gln) amidotransferase subunit GatC [Kiritimatiellia bacterium]
MESQNKSPDAPEKIDVSYVAHLARIALSSDEKPVFQDQLEHILEHVTKLNELDVTGVEPMAHAIPVKNRFRDDEVSPGISRDAVLRNAPDSRHEQFFVPRILE